MSARKGKGYKKVQRVAKRDSTSPRTENNKVDEQNVTIDQLKQQLQLITSKINNIKTFNKAVDNLVVGNPYVRNMVLKNLKTVPYLPDSDIIEEALKNPRNNEKLLRAIGGKLFSTCFPLYKLIRFYEGVLTYHYYVTPRNVNPEYIDKPRFKQEELFVNEWVEKLNPKYTFRRIVQEVMQEGKRAYYLREIYAEGKDGALQDVDDTEKDVLLTYDKQNRRVVRVFLQELPDDYIKITGKSTESYYTISFNFAYFFEVPGANINDYPPIFKKYLSQIQEFVGYDENGGLGIINQELASHIITTKFQSARYGYESNGINSKRQFYFWVDIPSDVCQVFSADETIPLQAPNFIGLFLMSIDLQTYNILQQQLTSVPLFSIVVGEMFVNEDDKTNPLVLDADIMDSFVNLINQNMPQGTTYVITPTKNNKLINFPEQPNAHKIYTSALQDMISTAGMAGLLSTTDKPTLSQVKTAQKTEKRFVDILYEQFIDFVNRRLEKMTDDGYLRYRWKFHLFGDIFSDDDEFDRLGKALAAGEIYYLPRRLAMKNLTLHDAQMIAHQVLSSGVYDLLRPLVSAYQQSPYSNGKTPFDTETKKEIPDDQIENENTANNKESGLNKASERFTVNEVANLINNVNQMQNVLNELTEQIKMVVDMIEDRDGE